MDHVEVGVEGCGFVDRRHGQRHVACQRPESVQRQMPVGVLDGMQMLDQQIAPAQLGVLSLVAKQLTQRFEDTRIGLAALESRARTPTSAGGCHGVGCIDGHWLTLVISM